MTFIKRTIFSVILILSVSLLYSQQKYALVIGNGNYTGISRLNNPVNDANDMEAALRELGFTVDKVLDGSLTEMENAVMRLKNRLSVSKDSYGFLFYAGHGVQSNSVNYLIPVNANIPSENYLRDRTISVQAMLDELNDAGNALNIVVLDACRDNPFGWARSGSRGLTVLSNQPADSIIVYATSAGSTAADGAGRNGLFTSHLLINLKIPGLEITEVFRLTGAAVSQASGRQQIPAIYNQFFGTAYLGSRPSQSGNTAQTYYERGMSLYNQSNYDAAIQEFTEAIRIDPNYALAYYNRGNSYRYKNDYDRAIADYTQAIRLDPNYRNAYSNRGFTYNEFKNEYDTAIADFNQAIRIDPNYALAYYNRGLAYYRKNDYDTAIADYTQVIRIDPNYANAYFGRGLAYRNKNDYDTAIADYNQAIRLNPNLAIAYNNRGNAYNGKGDYDAAIADYTQAIRLDPNDAIAYNNRGAAYWYKDDYDAAITDYNKAIQLDPNYAFAYQGRGLAYQQKGDQSRADADFAKARELGYR
jgi:tetratricopeptide (TPR) repeat protein